jgi:RHH-type transcriptional regulator, proline utilization regulon repressor / proline dehydrogenase / delta 1-pyrroline-5-carboxylate dehydrogenase
MCNAALTPLPPRSALRTAITDHTRAPEPDCIAALLPLASVPPGTSKAIRVLARRLVEALRRKGTSGGVEALIQEFSLSSQEGIALMCLAEALLRIPDTATRDRLIREKIGGGRWRDHLGHSPSVFVNAATWGLVISGTLAATAHEATLSNALTRLIARGGEPVLRKGVDLAMRMMGEQFVSGKTIQQALARARPVCAKGFNHSYDMLGEAALTASDAHRYYRDYESAIHAIGQSANGRGLYAGPGISIKLSALHPRYSRSQQTRVVEELWPRLQALAHLAKHYDIGLNIDAEEADRLELSLDLLEAVCEDAQLAGWNGIGFVVQAYQKRAPFVLDYLIDLARRSGHRLMVRLVKGAYWDSEIKRAQVDGVSDFPVYTRKVHTDIAYIACVRKLLDARNAVFPQFATHNAQTLATIFTLAGADFRLGDWEFQCLHGMGEPLYQEVVGPLNRPCRIYAPVGSHETLLAYLVRRLLENGANTSFVSRIQDSAVSVEELIADPARQSIGARNPQIALPPDLFTPERRNAAGFDLSNEATLRHCTIALSNEDKPTAYPLLAAETRGGISRRIVNPADNTHVGDVIEATVADIDIALTTARPWSTTCPLGRARRLNRAADMLEAEPDQILSLLIREAGKTVPNAISEIREAVDFLRYYATQIPGLDTRPLGPVACISPWNFPLSIFVGQLAAALAAGNSVLAKPAEETPLVAHCAVSILHAAGVPRDALQVLPGDGVIGAALVADPRIQGVMFTGSTAVAQHINRQLAKRRNSDGQPVTLIAETGGQNALFADSSALKEQVVADVMVSAFDSAGQRCSALRVLCLQEDTADGILEMLRGAMAELSVGNPNELATDIGPVISAGARDRLLAHIEAMRDRGYALFQIPLPQACEQGTFVPPTLIEIPDLSVLMEEVFGPVLHVVRFRRANLTATIRTVNATGFGLTCGVHSRIDETIAQVTSTARAGNLYVNRNLIGAVVGVQPFGGHGLSGTGPKAGGPLYVRRLTATRPAIAPIANGTVPQAATHWSPIARSQSGLYGTQHVLPGPVGETNLYRLLPRGIVACFAVSGDDLSRQITAALATGNRALIPHGVMAIPKELSSWIIETPVLEEALFDAALFRGHPDRQTQLARDLAERDGPIIPLLAADDDGNYNLDALMLEQSISTNTAAAGGNASLLMLG